MQPIKLTIDQEQGYVFEGNVPGSIVFVPEEHTLTFADGSIVVDHAAFLLSGWAEKSIRFDSAHNDFDRAFPIDSRPIVNAEDPRIGSFVEHLRNAYEVCLHEVK